MFNENDVILLFTMAHKQCHLLISRCKIGDFYKRKFVYISFKTYLKISKRAPISNNHIRVAEH